ncbi:MAG TPA: hypothetical protein PL044_02070 [Clostridiales bacterium]|nr:MAG: hypothetical protein BWY37_00453 [Firmicutes bacterium ADurb.Bin262]HOU09763.1 hypothetical protein [Clostridiales bacterium]HQK72554.1 hypothetical protein [Clostridiales bacterium]
MQRDYFDRVHFWGRISSVTALAVMLGIPLSISLHFGIWPQAAGVLNGLLKIIPMFWSIAVIEVLTYAPLLGAGGTYLSFVTGNISNLKLPCAINAMQNAKVSPSSEEGEVISTIAVASSSITTTLIIAVGVLAFSPLLPVITAEDSAIAPAFKQVVPALFGALGAGYFSKHFKISLVPIAAGVLILLVFPALPVGTLIPVTVIISLLGAHLSYKHTQKKEKKRQNQA